MSVLVIEESPCRLGSLRTNLQVHILVTVQPRTGSGVEGIDLLHFLAGCCKRRLNQALSILSLSLGFLNSVFCHLLRPLLCSVSLNLYVFDSWLFWLSCQYLPNDWLGRLPRGSLFMLRTLSLQRPGPGALTTFLV